MAKIIRLYHYMKSEYLEDFLKGGEIKLTNISRTNDSMEFYPTHLAKRQSDYYFAMHTLDDFRRNNPLLILSLSRLMSSPSLWGNYADSHRGICLVFDLPIVEFVTENMAVLENKVKLFKVKYSPYRLMLSLLDMGVEEDKQGILRCGKTDYQKLYSALSYKGLDWAYENEYRLDLSHFIESESISVKNGLFFYDGLLSNLKGIMLGVDCDFSVLYVKRLLKEFTKTNNLNIKVDRVSIDKQWCKMSSSVFYDSPSMERLKQEIVNEDVAVEHLMLGDAYCWGNPRIVENLDLAEYHYRKASEMGNTEAMRLLASVYLTKENKEQYVFWMQQAADKGDERAKCELKIYMES